MSIGNASAVRSTIPGVHKVQGVWTGGGAAGNCTHAAADWSQGISSLNYNAATGKYKLTFTEVGQQIVGHSIKVSSLTGGVVVANLLRHTFSSTAKTVEVEFFGSGLQDLLTTDEILVDVSFAKFAP